MDSWAIICVYFLFKKKINMTILIKDKEALLSELVGRFQETSPDQVKQYLTNTIRWLWNEFYQDKELIITLERALPALDKSKESPLFMINTNRYLDINNPLNTDVIIRATVNELFAEWASPEDEENFKHLQQEGN